MLNTLKQVKNINYNGDNMKIIAQQNNSSNAHNFWLNVTQKDYIFGMSLNIALTKDNQVITYSFNDNNSAIINTIESSTLNQLNNYKIELFENTLKKLNQMNMRKDIYVNIAPFRVGILTDENILATTERINLYIDKIIETVNRYPNLTIHLHSINRNILS